MTDPFAGTLAWIWNISKCSGGNAAAIVGQLQAAGCAGALVKVADGNHGYNDWNAAKSLIEALRAAGLSALTWSYNYDGSAAEQSASVQALTSCGSDAHVFDTEIEMEQLARPDTAATALAAGVRAAFPALPLAYAPIGSIRNHLRAPFRQFTDADCVMLPQTYYTGFGWTPQRTLSEFYADVAQYNLTGQPIYPAYMDAPSDGLGSTSADALAFANAAKAAGAAGVSVWSYEHLDKAGWARVKAVTGVFPRVAPAPPQPDYQALYEESQRQLAAAYARITAGITALQG